MTDHNITVTTAAGGLTRIQAGDQVQIIDGRGVHQVRVVGTPTGTMMTIRKLRWWARVLDYIRVRAHRTWRWLSDPTYRAYMRELNRLRKQPAPPRKELDAAEIAHRDREWRNAMGDE